MINHARTLLLNKSGNTSPSPTFYGEEYVPTAYKAVILPSELLQVRRALFGAHPDDAGLNYALWQYMRILHSTEFEEYVYALDPRVTYLHAKSLVDYDYGPSVLTNAEALWFVGKPKLGDTDGRLQENWEIKQLSLTTYELRNMYTGTITTDTVTITNNITALMPIPDQPECFVSVDTNAATVTDWFITYIAAPTQAMDPTSRAAQLSQVGAGIMAELFPNREPFKIFKALWEQESRFAYKLSGALLALIYRTEELRRG